MNGIPHETDWAFLEDKELLQICIGRHQVCLRFDSDVSIEMECEFEHVSGRETGPKEIAERAKTLVSLLDARITKVAVQGDKTLVVSFSNDEVLRIYDSNSTFESFQVRGLGKQIVI